MADDPKPSTIVIIDKREYFLKALKAEAFKHKRWVISVFSVFRIGAEEHKEKQFPYKIRTGVRSKEGYWAILDPNNTEGFTIIGGSSGDEPLFTFKEQLKLKAGDLPNLKKDVTTTYGNALFNAMVLCWPFGDKVDYVEGRVNSGALENEIATRLVDIPADGKRDPKAIYVDELLKYMEAMSATAGFAALCAPAASPRTMVSNPEVTKRRDELLKQYADQLNDPAIVAMIEKELVEMDRKAFADDPSRDFYIKNKTFATSRKTCFIMHGMESGFGESVMKPETITTSLEEGIKPKDFPALVSGLRNMSFSRGAETALGGESVKYFYRVFQNTKIAEPDCGVTEGLSWNVTDANYKTFINLYQIIGNKPVLITAEIAKASIGKKIYIRSPMLCKSEAPSFCAICVGKALAETPTGLHIACSDVGSAFMSASLAAAHAKSLQTERFLFKSHIA